MASGLLLCDIGNTCIKIGIANEQGLGPSFSLPTMRNITGDSLGLDLLAILAKAGVAPHEIEACVASSVAPYVDPCLRQAVERYLGCPLLFGGADLAVPLENRYLRPGEVGADRLIGAYAARKLFPEPASLIIVDYGTAVTFDCVEANAYLGGLIFPGPGTATEALALRASLLPFVNLDMDGLEPTPGRDTRTSIQHGIVFGFVSLTEGLCDRLGRQLQQPVFVVGTGGMARSLSRFMETFDALVPELLLGGLRLLYMENKEARL